MAVGPKAEVRRNDAGAVRRHSRAHGHRGQPAEGLIFHSAGPIDGGWGVIDFWESRADFDRFLGARLGPAIAELGGPSAGEPAGRQGVPGPQLHQAVAGAPRRGPG